MQQTIKKLFKMQISKNELRRGKKILALAMLPILIFQMTSMNFLTMELVKTSADDAVVAEDAPKVEEKIIEEMPKVEAFKVEEGVMEEALKEGVKKVKISREEVASVAEVAPTVVPSTNSTSESAILPDGPAIPILDQSVSIMDFQKDSLISAAPATDSKAAMDEKIEISTLVEKECLDSKTEIKDSVMDGWNVDEEKGIAETKNVVVLGVKYIFPLKEKVAVTFSCLPKDLKKRATLKIERIDTSKINLPGGVWFAGDFVYDITTGMNNGDFKYEITLPKTENIEMQVFYIEKSAEEIKKEKIKPADLKEIKQDKIEQEKEAVKVIDLDHFTVFGAVAVALTASPDAGFITDAVDPNFGSEEDVEFKFKIVYTGSSIVYPTWQNLFVVIKRKQANGTLVEYGRFGMSSDADAQNPILKNGDTRDGEQYVWATKLMEGEYTYHFEVAGSDARYPKINEGELGDGEGGIFTSVSAKFSIGDRTGVSYGLVNVRQTANGTVLGTQVTHARGTILDGPILKNGYWWWKINYDKGVDGWSAEDYLDKYRNDKNINVIDLKDNSVLGDCSLVGTWDKTLRACIFTKDLVNKRIEIVDGSITIDGNGHSITADDGIGYTIAEDDNSDRQVDGYDGISIGNNSGVAVKNFSVSGFYHGISSESAGELVGFDFNSFQNIIVIENITAKDCYESGVDINYSNNCVIKNNEFKGNKWGGLVAMGLSNCYVEDNTVSNTYRPLTPKPDCNSIRNI